MKVRFGGFVLDTAARQLTRAGRELRLSPKAFDLLAVLVARRPAVLEKRVLRSHLWPDTHVVDASLSNLVAELRALGDADDPMPVRTVHGVGYAFAGAAEHLGEREAGTERPPGWVVWRDRPWPLAAGENIVGRDASCEVWIDEGGVSRRHARIQVSLDAASGAGEATIEDLNSTNGTLVGGQRVSGVVRLRDGDVLTLGPEKLVYRTRATVDAPTKRVRSRP